MIFIGDLQLTLKPFLYNTMAQARSIIDSIANKCLIRNTRYILKKIKLEKIKF